MKRRVRVSQRTKADRLSDEALSLNSLSLSSLTEDFSDLLEIGEEMAFLRENDLALKLSRDHWRLRNKRR